MSADEKLYQASSERERVDLEKSVEIYNEAMSLTFDNPTKFVHALLGQAKSFKLLYQKDKSQEWLEKHKNLVEDAKFHYPEVRKSQQILIQEGEAKVAGLYED